MSRAPEQTDALILRTRDFGEADRIVTALTPDLGHFSGFAPHARRSTKRFGAGLSPGAVVRLHFTPRAQGLAQLSHLDSIHIPHATRDFAAFARVGVWLALVEHSSVEGQASPERFACAVEIAERLQHAESGASGARILLAGLKTWLRMLGYAPELAQCVHCGRSIAEIPFVRFVPLDGGVICVTCAPSRPAWLCELSLVERAAWQALSLEQFAELSFDTVDLSTRAQRTTVTVESAADLTWTRDALWEYLRCILQKPLNVGDYWRVAMAW